jgi:hypothetical protein
MAAFEQPIASPAPKPAAPAPGIAHAPATASGQAAPRRPRTTQEHSVLARLLSSAVARRSGEPAHGVLGRARLQRLKKEHEVDHLKLGYAIENVENYRALLLATQRNWNEYQYQVYLPIEIGRKVDPHIARLKAILADIEGEVEPDARIAEAKTVIPKALKALNELSAMGQEADQAAVKKAYESGKEERVKRMNKELSNRQAAAAAEAQLQQAEAQALAIQSSITATGVTPNAGGPAFSFPTGYQSAVRRDNLHTWITLSWKQFRYLPREALNKPKCFVYHLSLAQLEALMNRLGDETVTEYDFQGWPSTRPALAGGVDGLVMPVKLGSMSAYFGAEILIDWIVPNHGHTTQAANLVASFNFTADQDRFESFGGVVTSSNGKIKYQYATGRRLIVNQARDTVITYYHGAV